MSTCQPTEIGSRRELFVDDALIAALSGAASLRLHQPVPREVALVTDQPWEGNMCGYVTVFPDDGLFRMYYRGWQVDLRDEHSQGEQLFSPHGLNIAYAESTDGIHWQRPALNRYSFPGVSDNNIVWQDEGVELDGLAPFKDSNPSCLPDARYKAVGGTYGKGLYALQSPDGIHWSLLSEKPIITDGMFDSQNLVFWDAVRGEYRAYIRDFRNGCRAIRTATSPDFVQWTTPEWLEYPGAPEEQLYTNQVLPYYRAPHLFLGFPTRYVERDWSPVIEALPELEHRKLRAGVNQRFGASLTDGLFMAGRDGRVFKRWDEAFIRPGLRTTGSWAYGDCYQAWGLLETPSAIAGAPPELSMYATEGYWRGTSTTFRRYTLRIDGFVSLHAPLRSGELVTAPLRFTGNRLQLNLSTSAAGSLRVEMQTPDGAPYPGFSLAECHKVIGDALDYTVSWQSGADVGRLAGQPVCLRFVLHDADLYSYQFVDVE
ncbi:MAG: glycoside hydrolase family protein [Armatimonadota bacterium]